MAVTGRPLAAGERFTGLFQGSRSYHSLALVAAPLSAAQRDFNSDGKDDILWQNTATGDRYIWFMNGSTHAGEVYLGVVAPTWQIR